jgi:hypothetical protein
MLNGYVEIIPETKGFAVVLSENCVTNVLQAKTTKGLHFCNPFVFQAPPLGLEPRTL